MTGGIGKTTIGWLVAFGVALASIAAAMAAVGDDWRDLAWPEHRARIEGALPTAVAVDASGGAYAKDFAQARALLERARRPLRLGDVAGAWQVRSIQVSGHGTFAYPWFRARIGRTGNGLRFEKTTGSQRRSGRLLPHADGRSLVFLGGTTVNDDPQAGYSRVRPDAEPAASDSAGRLVRISGRELLMVLDAEGGRYELYHLRR